MEEGVARGCLQAAKISKMEGGVFGGFSHWRHWRTVLADFLNAKGFPAFFLKFRKSI
jgi:hypothetical protein